MHQILVGHTNISFCERLNFNPFMCAFVNFTIVVFDLAWFHVMLYSITYVNLFSDFYALSTYFRCIIMSILKSPKQVLE